MFGSIKKAMAVAAVVGVGALAASPMASADKWNVPFPTPTQVSSGTLAITVTSTGTTTSCSSVTTSTGGLILNNGSPTSGAWRAMALLSSLNLNNCVVVGQPACNVLATADFSGGNWTVDGDAASQRVRINNAKFTNAYSGTGCTLAGVTAVVDGTVTGDYDGAGTLSFTNEPGLSVTSPPLGAARLNGSVYIDAAAALVVS